MHDERPASFLAQCIRRGVRWGAVAFAGLLLYVASVGPMTPVLMQECGDTGSRVWHSFYCEPLGKLPQPYKRWINRYIAFFDLGENKMPLPSPNTPGWVMHFAVEVDSVAEVEAMGARLKAAGVEVTPVVDHHFIQSIYFFDPNGLRLEVTARVDEPGFLEQQAAEAHDILKDWGVKKAGLLAGAS